MAEEGKTNVCVCVRCVGLKSKLSKSPSLIQNAPPSLAAEKK